MYNYILSFVEKITYIIKAPYHLYKDINKYLEVRRNKRQNDITNDFIFFRNNKQKFIFELTHLIRFNTIVENSIINFSIQNEDNKDAFIYYSIHLSMMQKTVLNLKRELVELRSLNITHFQQRKLDIMGHYNSRIHMYETQLIPELQQLIGHTQVFQETNITNALSKQYANLTTYFEEQSKKDHLELTDLRTQLGHLQHESNDLNTQVNNLTPQVNALTTQRDNLIAQIVELQKKNTLLIDANEYLERQNNAYHDKLVATTRSLELAQDEYSQRVTLTNKMETALSKISQDNKQLELALNDARATILQQEVEIQNISKVKNQYIVELNQKERDYAQVMETSLQITTQTDENRKLAEKNLHEAKKREQRANETLKEMQDNHAKIIASNKELRKVNEGLNQVLNKPENSEIQALINSNRSLNKIYTHLTEKQKAFELLNATLSLKWDSIRNQQEKLDNIKDQYKDQLKTCKTHKYEYQKWKMLDSVGGGQYQNDVAISFNNYVSSSQQLTPIYAEIDKLKTSISTETLAIGDLMKSLTTLGNDIREYNAEFQTNITKAFPLFNMDAEGSQYTLSKPPAFGNLQTSSNQNTPRSAANIKSEVDDLPLYPTMTTEGAHEYIVKKLRMVKDPLEESGNRPLDKLTPSQIQLLADAIVEKPKQENIIRQEAYTRSMSTQSKPTPTVTMHNIVKKAIDSSTTSMHDNKSVIRRDDSRLSTLSQQISPISNPVIASSSNLNTDDINTILD
jgi:hypothetical protein